MKTIFVLILSLAAGSAHAGRNADVPGQAVTCTSTAEKLTVTINAARTQVNDGKDTYQVTDRQSDGDAFVAYVLDGGRAVLSFDDNEGDSIDFSGAGGDYIPLVCPQ